MVFFLHDFVQIRIFEKNIDKTCEKEYSLGHNTHQRKCGKRGWCAPRTEDGYREGDDIIIELEKQTATKYHIEVFDVESDEYAVNEYITTDETVLTLPSI